MENIIFDFDGTLTDVEKSSQDFQEKYPMVCADLLGINYSTMEKRFYELKNNLKNHPEKGFVINGYDSLPANSEPYIRCQATMKDFIKEMSDCGFKVPQNTESFLSYSYKKAKKISNDKIYFREGIEDFLENIKSKYNIFIVTNSNGKKIRKNLESINHDDIMMYTNANKRLVYSPDPCISLSGFPRDILINRKEYYGALNFIRKRKFYPNNTIVVGDVFELDLALPETASFDIIQIDNGATPLHERKYMEEFHHFANNLKELEEILMHY
jgi:FMN phosphatase YigB (HAD superfamily)